MTMTRSHRSCYNLADTNSQRGRFSICHEKYVGQNDVMIFLNF